MISLGCSLKRSANRRPISPMYTVDGHFNFTKSIFYLMIFIIASLSSTFVERAMRISLKRLIKKYLDSYLETTHLHTPLFLQKSKVNCTSLCNKRVQNFLILLYKSLFDTPFPAYMKNMFSLRSSSYDLRGKYILSLSRPKTTAYGLNSFSYFSANQWKALLDFFRTSFIWRL